MKIIKIGEISEDKQIKKTYYSCKTEFDFDNSDIRSDRDGRYVICPLCVKFIEV